MSTDMPPSDTNTDFAPDHVSSVEATWCRTPDEPQGTSRTASTTTVTARIDNARNLPTYPSIGIHINTHVINDDIVDNPDAHNLHTTAVSTSVALSRDAASTLVAQLNAALHYQDK